MRVYRLPPSKLVSREVECPLCGSKFRHSTPRSGTYSLLRRDSDLCPRYSGVNPTFYLVYVCPDCHFAAYRQDFGNVTQGSQIRALLESTTLGNAVDFRQPERSLFAALRSFELARLCYRAREFPAEVQASLSHRAAWICRLAGELGREVHFLAEARDLYKSAFEHGVSRDRPINDLTVAFLVGELMLRTGQIAEAQPYLRIVAQAGDAKPTLLRTAKDRLQDAKQIAQIQRFLDGIDLFQPIKHLLGIVAAVSEKHSLPHGAVLCKKGDPGSSMFVVTSGEARIYLEDPSGAQPVATLGPGDYLGEMSLFLGQPRSATIVAGALAATNKMATALEVIEIPKTAFRNLLKLEAEVMHALADVIAQRKHENDEWQERYERSLPEAAEGAAVDATVDSASAQSLLLPKIRRFFGLAADGSERDDLDAVPREGLAAK